MERVRNDKVADYFIDGIPAQGHGAVWTDGNVYYSYKEPIAIRDTKTSGIWVNTEYYSVTTSKHLSYIHSALAGAGFKPTSQYMFGYHLLDYPFMIRDAEFQLWR